MTKNNILTKAKMPFCPGCGHGISVRSISKSLTKVGYGPLDTVIVSDIGCSGLVDPLFATHTIHGLHGRAPGLAVGVSLGLSGQNKKVVVIQGDGGATIGLQHIMEAARRNINMTLVIFNNLLYGMTGGQISGLSTNEYKDIKNVADDAPPFDIIKLAHYAGAAYTHRVNSVKDFDGALEEAFAINGFSVVELSSLCPSHGLKKMDELVEVTQADDKMINHRPAPQNNYLNTKSLFDSLDIVESKFDSGMKDRFGIVIAGSAGGGVQSAAKLLANAGISSGLFASMKGEYPITVGTGFSLAEVIFSRDKINFTGLESPDMIIVVSQDGLKKIEGRIKPDTILIMDEKLKNDNFKNVIYGNFQQVSGKRGAALSALSYWVDNSDVLTKEAFVSAVKKHKYADKLMMALTNDISIEKK